VLAHNDLRSWADRFLDALSRKPSAVSWTERLGMLVGLTAHGASSPAYGSDAFRRV
jgi:hypothetical protein